MNYLIYIPGSKLCLPNKIMSFIMCDTWYYVSILGNMELYQSSINRHLRSINDISPVTQLSMYSHIRISQFLPPPSGIDIMQLNLILDYPNNGKHEKHSLCNLPMTEQKWMGHALICAVPLARPYMLSS